jgi:hypothetical protein
MGSRALHALTVAAVCLSALAAPAVAAAPAEGIFNPGESLGGVRLGMSETQVRALWGTQYGVCRNCDERTWYFNLKPFEPQGAGVEFRDGDVARVFTVWRPLGWSTADGLGLGVRLPQLRDAVPELEVRPCDAYTAYLVDRDAATSVYWVFRGRLWGFGLMRPGLSPCL